MPNSARMQEAAAARIVAAYGDSEARLLQLLARRLAAGRKSGYDVWAARKVTEARVLAAAAASREADLTARVTRLVQEQVAAGYQAGSATAAGQLQAANVAAPPLTAGTPRAVQLLAEEAVGGITQAHQGMLRWVDDVYRQVQAEVAEMMATGTATLPQAIERSLGRYAARGVRGFVDSAGRGWGLQEYSEMATRTAVGRAHVEGGLDRQRAAGRQLVIVSDSPDECPLCRPWEGRVLGIDGPVTRGTTLYPAVSDAIAAGLFHPNCTHQLGAYIEGLTKPMQNTGNPAGYELRQEQRYRERAVRQWKRREAAAITDEGKAHARRHLKAARQRYNDFIDRNDRIPVGWRTRLLTPKG